MELLKNFTPGSMVVMAVTFILFAAALVTTGLTHDLLLEAGVFLVSVKLMMMTYRNTRASADLDTKLDRIQESVARMERRLESASRDCE